VLHLQLNEIESDGRKIDDISDLISPINIRDNKHFRINTNDLNEKGEKSIINLISPANDDKQAFDFSKNNFLPRKYSNKTSESKNEIKINYYANNISISNNNNYYNSSTIEPQQKSMSNENFDFKQQIHNQNNMYMFGGNNMNVGGNVNNFNNPYSGNQYSQQQFNGFPPQQFNPNFQSYQPNSYYRDLQPNTMPLSKMGERTIEKKKRQFAERQGDWVCMKCKNLNFSFRLVCNRCQLPKNESEVLYHEHMSNLKNLNRQNDMLQNQIFSQGMSMANGFNSNMFSPNPIGNPIYGAKNVGQIGKLK